MNRIIILVIFLSFTTSLQAQSVESDELFSKGVELYNLKRYNEAISYFNKSNNIDKAQLDTTNSRRYYSEMWLSSCYMQLGKIKEAQAISPDYYMVPPIDRRLTVESDRFSELSNMFAQAGNLERALEYALRCADIEKQVAGKEHIWYGNSTIIIGNLYYALGDSINAEENYLINKNICKHTYGEYSERYVDALLSLASVNTDFSMKDGLDKATRYLDEAYSIAHKRYPLLEAQIVNQQSVIAFRNKNYEQAKTLMMQALSLCELAEGKTSNNYEILLSNTIDLYQMFGQYDEAITLGQDFLEACNQANRSDSIPAFIMVKISQANIAKGDINNALIQIEKAENIMRQYGTAKVDYINILGIMSTIYSNAGNKQKAISLNSKVLEFLEKKSKYPTVVRLFSQKQLSTIPTTDYYNTTALSNLIWKPLHHYLAEKKNVYFSPSGELNNIAIEYIPLTDKKTFAEYYNTYRLSSTRELIKNKREDIRTKAVLYGGLEYERGQGDIEAMRKELQSAESLIAFRDVPEIDSLVLRKGISFLEGTEREVQTIDTLLRNKQIPVALMSGMAGTEESFKQLSGQSITLLHVATHGFYSPLTGHYTAQRSFEEQALSRSGLFLSGAAASLNMKKIPEDIEDGILTAKELSKLDLSNLNLAILSACQTGLGEIVGDGVFGLQRGFKKAGAQTLLMSLWKVDDTATQLLMAEFYKNLVSGQNKRAAFLNAQKYLRSYQNGIYDKPEYWAAFIMLDGIH